VKRVVVPYLLVIAFLHASHAQSGRYLGFDRNEYPGDETLQALHRSFFFTGFWLNNPPGTKNNSWVGKRNTLQKAGFGFLVVFNGRSYAEIKTSGDANRLGAADAAAAVSSARREGFPSKTIIFLDQEEGGRLLPEQREYLHAWVDGIIAAAFRAGVYCSGIAYKEGSGVSVITAEDIRKNSGKRSLSFWISNDACPPSPGCAVPKQDLVPSASGIPFADIWQFAQSPRRDNFANQCSATYNADKSCYLPDTETPRLAVDLNVAASADPSHGRTEE